MACGGGSSSSSGGSGGGVLLSGSVPVPSSTPQGPSYQKNLPATAATAGRRPAWVKWLIIAAAGAGLLYFTRELLSGEGE